MRRGAHLQPEVRLVSPMEELIGFKNRFLMRLLGSARFLFFWVQFF